MAQIARIQLQALVDETPCETELQLAYLQCIEHYMRISDSVTKLPSFDEIKATFEYCAHLLNHTRHVITQPTYDMLYNRIVQLSKDGYISVDDMIMRLNYVAQLPNMYKFMGNLAYETDDNGNFLIQPPEFTANNAEFMLLGSSPKTFIIRFSHSLANTFALSYVTDENTIEHVLIPIVEGGVSISEKEGENSVEKIYPCLKELIEKCRVCQRFRTLCGYYPKQFMAPSLYKRNCALIEDSI
jgi:SH2 domain